jgi:peroxin-6
VTVARVASPYSNDCAYQPFFLRALKEYFDGQKRLIKKGDLIAVGIQAELARLIKERESEDTQTSEEIDRPDEDSELLTCE